MENSMNKSIIPAASFVDAEVTISQKDSNGEWYEAPLKEVVDFYDCYYLMIGDEEDWTFLPDMLGRDFYLDGVRCTVEKIPPIDYMGERFIVVEV
jgi:hypothetical protein